MISLRPHISNNTVSGHYTRENRENAVISPSTLSVKHKFIIVIVLVIDTRSSAIAFRVVTHQDFGCQKIFGVQALLAVKAHQ